MFAFSANSLGVGGEAGDVLSLRWLEIVSSTYIIMDRYNNSLSLDATIMVSQNCPTIGEHVVVIFVTQ